MQIKKIFKSIFPEFLFILLRATSVLFHPTSNCAYKKKVLNDLPNKPEVREKFIDPFRSLYDYVTNNSGKTIRVPSDIQDFYFILKSEDDMNYTIPEWTRAVYPNMVEYATSFVYPYHNYDTEVKKINSGYMLKKILDDSTAKMSNNQEERKIFLYSGHESTVGYMLDALNIEQKSVPPYGCALSFELRKLNNRHFIRLKYRNDTEATAPIDLNIPGCDVMCPIDTFQALLLGIVPTKSITETCNTPYL